jgi:FdhE protein
MSQVGAPQHSPIPIGEVTKPPFVRLPDPLSIFVHRTLRLRVLTEGHDLRAYLQFLAGLTEAQHRIQDALPAVELPDTETLARAATFAMPPLDRGRFTADLAFETTFTRLLALADEIVMPEAARLALARVTRADAGARADMARAVLADAVPVEALAEHAFMAAALQVHYARLAAGLTAERLVPVGDGSCPACGGPPVASLIVGWPGAHGARFCACALCSTLWHHVRIKCTLCGSTGGIGYQEVEGGAGLVKAECCDSCRSYVKVLHQHKEPALDPVADDIATLALDLLLRDSDYRRGAVNPFLLGY